MYRIFTGSLLLMLSFSSCKSLRPTLPGTAWERHDSSARFDQGKMDDLTTYIDENARTTGLVAIYQGKVLYEYGDVKKISYIASCRKSVLSMLYGKHIDNGTIDLNQTIGELGINEADGLLESELQATVDHIITSRSGVFHVASNGGYDLDNFKTRGTVEPGEYWVYNNWDFNVAGHILEQKTGNTVYEELEEQLAIPLGFQDWNINNQRKYGEEKKSQYQAYHIYVSTRDMAKMGQLMLNEGEWNGEQLISREWVARSTATVTPHDTLVARFGQPGPDVPKMSYSYMWWNIDNYKNLPAFEGAYTATGYGGQFITVLPAVDMVVALKTNLSLTDKIGWTYHETSREQYFEMLERLVEMVE